MAFCTPALHWRCEGKGIKAEIGKQRAEFEACQGKGAEEIRRARNSKSDSFYLAGNR